MDAQHVAEALGGAKRVAGGWMARCPVHEDGHASLSLTDGRSGKLLVRCHAGCAQADVVEALKLKDLWPEPARDATPRPGARRIVATYPYTDVDGVVLFEAVRFEPKDFRQRRPAREGDDPTKVRDGFVWSIAGCEIVPYMLPELVRCPLGQGVFVVEGEKDVHALRAIGCTATCNPMGAGKWPESFARWFKGRRVIILPDNDEPGEKHARLVADRLAGVAADVRVLRLPGLTDHGDVSDWLTGGGTKEALAALVKTAPRASVAFGHTEVAATAPIASQRPAQAAGGATVTDIAAKRAEKQVERRQAGGYFPWEGRPWANRLIVNGRGEPKPLLANAIEVLSSDPDWSGVLAFDTFALRALALREPPCGGGAGHWTDDHDIVTAEWLQRVGIHVNPQVAASAVQAVAARNRFHPVQQFLRGLIWDGVARCSFWLEQVAGAEPSEYVRAVARKWLISAVARIFEPGCKVDTMLVLEGEQDLKKSTAFDVLGGEWFTDDLHEMGSKDSAMQAAGAWIIEVAELDGMSRADVNAVKAFLTRRVDRFRPPYGRRIVAQPRQAVFGGTVNPDGAAYLRDNTGGRRFWPVVVTRVVDVQALAAMREQLWAEAVHRYRAGEPWWFAEGDEQAKAEAKAAQEDRRHVDEWTALIERYLTAEPVPGPGGSSTWVRRPTPLAEVRVADLLRGAIGLEGGRWSHPDQMRVARVLKELGFRRFRPNRDGDRTPMYRRPTVTGSTADRDEDFEAPVTEPRPQEYYDGPDGQDGHGLFDNHIQEGECGGEPDFT